MRKIFPPLLLDLGINRIDNAVGDYDFLMNLFFKFLFKYSLKNLSFAAEDL